MQAFTNVGYRGLAKVQRKVLSSITSEANRVLPNIDGDGIAAAATAFKTDMLVLCDRSYMSAPHFQILTCVTSCPKQTYF